MENKKYLEKDVFAEHSRFMERFLAKIDKDGDLKDIEKLKRRGNIKTGFKNLDKYLDGLEPGLYIIGAITGLGKTTFVHQMSDQLAKEGEDIVFFSLEQSLLQMLTKSYSRITAQKNIEKAVEARKIRKGMLTKEVLDAREEYRQINDRINMVVCPIGMSIKKIKKYVESYIKFTGKKPIVIIDYLQIISPEDPRLIGREKIDSVIQDLKNFQIRNNLIVLAISSFNRDNYSQVVDLTSFKESGSIEFTADVVWGLQLAILNDEVFGKEKNTKEKREKVMEAKKEIPRKIELVCLKSRSSSSTYTCDFNYDPRYDLFIPAKFQKHKENSTDEDKFRKLCANANISI